MHRLPVSSSISWSCVGPSWTCDINLANGHSRQLSPGRLHHVRTSRPVTPCIPSLCVPSNNLFSWQTSNLSARGYRTPQRASRALTCFRFAPTWCRVRRPISFSTRSGSHGCENTLGMVCQPCSRKVRSWFPQLHRQRNNCCGEV